MGVADVIRSNDGFKYVQDVVCRVWSVTRSRNVSDAAMFVAHLLDVPQGSEELVVQAAVKTAKTDTIRVVQAVYDCTEFLYGNRKLSLEDQSKWKLWLDMIIGH